jgi:hypothetical protein
MDSLQACPLCGSTNLQTADVSLYGVGWIRCRGCDLVANSHPSFQTKASVRWNGERKGNKANHCPLCHDLIIYRFYAQSIVASKCGNCSLIAPVISTIEEAQGFWAGQYFA